VGNGWKCFVVFNEVLMFITRSSYCVALRAKRLYIINSDALEPRVIVGVLALHKSFYDRKRTRRSSV
jgi:hypothetical protein